MIGIVIAGTGVRASNLRFAESDGFDPAVQVSDASQLMLDNVWVPFGHLGGVDIVRQSGFTSSGKPHLQLSNIHVNGGGTTAYGLRVRSTGSQEDYWITIVNLYCDLAVNNVVINDVRGVVISNLYATLAQEHGILLVDAERCRISGTVEASGRDNDATFDNIHVTGVSSQNWFNLLSFDRVGEADGPRYGLFFDTDTFDNIESSDLRNSGRTADYLDLGTNNRTTDEHMGDGEVGGSGSGVGVAQITAASLSGELDIYTGPHLLVWPWDVELVSIRATVGTAPVGDDLIVDVLINGVSAFPTTPNPQVDDGQNIGDLAIPDTVAVSAGTEVTFNIDQVGSTTPGSDLTVIVEWRRV